MQARRLARLITVRARTMPTLSSCSASILGAMRLLPTLIDCCFVALYSNARGVCVVLRSHTTQRPLAQWLGVTLPPAAARDTGQLSQYREYDTTDRQHEQHADGERG
jgi:hypothetical protein